MNFDIGPMQATTSPLALLAGPQVVAPYEDFAELMDVGAPPSKANRPIGNAGSSQALAAFDELKSSETPMSDHPEVNPAVAKADALVFALSPDTRISKSLNQSRETFVAITTEDTLSPAPKAGSITDPVAAPVAARSANTVASNLPTQEVARRPALMSRKALDDEAEGQSETGDQPDEANDDELVAKGVSADSNVSMPAIIQVSPIPAPIQETEAAIGGTTVATTNSPVPDIATREATPKTAPESNKLPDDSAVSSKEFGPVAADTPVQILETQSQSLSAARPAAVASKQIEIREPISEMAATFVANSEGRIVGKIASKIADSDTLEVPDTLKVTADISTNFDTMPLIKTRSDLPNVAHLPTAIVNPPMSTINTIVDRQLDLVRNERWLGELAEDIASTSASNDRLSFRLMPHQLGRLDIEVSRAHNGLSLTFRTENDSAQTILTAAQPRLENELRSQGLRLADTQMLSNDPRHSHQNGGASRPIQLIENFIDPTNAPDAPERMQRDGRYA